MDDNDTDDNPSTTERTGTENKVWRTNSESFSFYGSLRVLQTISTGEN